MKSGQQLAPAELDRFGVAAGRQRGAERPDVRPQVRSQLDHLGTPAIQHVLAQGLTEFEERLAERVPGRFFFPFRPEETEQRVAGARPGLVRGGQVSDEGEQLRFRQPVHIHGLLVAFDCEGTQ